VTTACVVVAASLGACGGETTPPTARGEQTIFVEATPSALARERLAGPQLQAALEAGRELDLDWTVIAAVAQLETLVPTSEAAARDQALAIGYALESLGARQSYSAALDSRGGPGFAQRALRLADRYRGGISAEVDVPTESGRLDPPVNGKVVAGFGRLYGRPHLGLDFDARDATEVRAAASGVVTATGSVPAYGVYICVLHSFPRALRGRRALNTCYGYLREPRREIGDRVGRGETVGLSGCSGLCVSPRVHFIVRVGERPDALPVDPAPFLGASQLGT
jgi:murein DD-endopeptidase MepM/ murein hydrolase activator NlpD